MFGVYRVIPNYCLISVTHIFQAGKNKLKLLTEYENLTQNVLLLVYLSIVLHSLFINIIHNSFTMQLINVY
jgi:hypothetical protein